MCKSTRPAGGRGGSFLKWSIADAGTQRLFRLERQIPPAKAKLVAACKKYLTGHPGTVFFAVGTLAEALNREVNVRDFDVGLHLIFTDQAAHDQYQDAPKHHQFVEENRDTWAGVRVFDTVAEG